MIAFLLVAFDKFPRKMDESRVILIELGIELFVAALVWVIGR